MSHEYRQMILEQKIMMGLPAIASASLRTGRSSGPRYTRPRKRPSSASAKPRVSVSKAGRAKRTAGANPSLHRFNTVEGRMAKPPRKPRAAGGSKRKRAGVRAPRSNRRPGDGIIAAAPGGLLAIALRRGGL